DTEIPQSSGPPKKVGDEAVYTREDDRVDKATTTATSLDAEQDSGGSPGCQEAIGGTIAQTRSERVPTPSYYSPLLGGHTLRSDEGRPNINELMAICTNLSNMVLALETSKTAQDFLINKRKSLDKVNVSKQGRNLKTRPMFEEGDFDDDFDDIEDMVNEAMENVEGDIVNTATIGVSAASASVTIAGVSISTAEPRTPPTTTTTIFEDEDLTIAQTLVKMRNKSKGIMQEPEKPPKNPIKAQIQRDAEIAQRLFEEEQAQFERVQRIARKRAAEQEANDAALIEKMEDIQARMDVDELLAERL
ncbi:hypothetical protein Tco_0453308, partial [Tanacetum coccineum]